MSLFNNGTLKIKKQMEKTNMEKFLEFFDKFPVISFLKGQWIALWNWVKLAHSSSEEASTKRLYGGIIVLNSILTFDLFAKGVFSLEAWTTLYSGWYSLLFMGAALISISTLEKLAMIIANFKIKSLFGADAPTDLGKSQ